MGSATGIGKETYLQYDILGFPVCLQQQFFFDKVNARLGFSAG
jgi:hypothetical protein